MKSNIYTAIDIGSSKISCIIFEKISKSDEIKILGFSTKCSIGIRAGIIENMQEATTSIASAIYEAEKQASITAKKVIVNISHPFTHSKLIITDSNFGGRQLLPKDLKNIFNKVVYSTSQFKHSVIQCSAIRYDIDMMENIAEPEYMFVNNLKSYHNIVTVPKNAILLLKKCLHRLHLIPTNYVLSSYASSLAFALEKFHDFIVLDIGGGTSDIAVFKKARAVCWAGSVPLGGENITRDILECFAVSYEDAEKLKILYGDLTSQNISKKLSLVKDMGLETKVNVPMLNKIILARVEEIIEIVLNRIPKQYRMKKIILCGGVANTLGITEFIAEKFAIEAIFAPHIEIFSEMKETFKSEPSFATILGLVSYILGEANKRKSFSIKKILEWMWENF